MGFCPSCGKKIKEGFCEECKPIDEIRIKDISVTICRYCDKALFQSRWTKFNNYEDAARKAILTSLKKDADVSIAMPETLYKESKKNSFSAHIEIGRGTYDVPGRLIFSQCPECTKKKSAYFEGTLQLRNADSTIVSFIEKYAEENHFFIADTKKSGNGVDMDISDQKKIQNLGHALEKRFGGTLKISPRIFTQDKLTSREVYRVNVYYEAPDFKPGDVIKAQGKIILVKSCGKNISGTDLKSGKSVNIILREKEYERLDMEKTTVSKAYPDIEVLDPRTFQSMPISNKAEVSNGEKVTVVIDEGKYYIAY